jgi:DNA-binding Lrp family transcriptional regulator
VLSTLAEAGPLSQIDLARALSIDRTAMVYLLDELEDARLVERVRNGPRERSPRARSCVLKQGAPGAPVEDARAPCRSRRFASTERAGS